MPWHIRKQGGSSRNGRDSNSQRLGLKLFGGEHAVAGNIIARQRAPSGTRPDVGLARTTPCSRSSTVRLSSVPKPRAAFSYRYNDDAGSGRVDVD